MTSWLKSLESVLEKVDNTASKLAKQPTKAESSPSKQNWDDDNLNFDNIDSNDLLNTSTTNTDISAAFSPVKETPEPKLSEDEVFSFLQGPLQEARARKEKSHSSSTINASSQRSTENQIQQPLPHHIQPQSQQNNPTTTSSSSFNSDIIAQTSPILSNATLTSTPQRIENQNLLENIQSQSQTHQNQEKSPTSKSTFIENNNNDNHNNFSNLIDTTSTTTTPNVNLLAQEQQQQQQAPPHDSGMIPSTPQTHSQQTQIHVQNVNSTPMIPTTTTIITTPATISTPQLISKTVVVDERVVELEEKLSEIGLENKLLRNEVMSVKQQISALSVKFKDTQANLQKATDMNRVQQKSLVDKQKQILSFKRKEEENEALIQTKTSQLAAIQLQLQDVTLKADSEKSHREQLQHQLEMTETQVKQISSERSMNDDAQLKSNKTLLQKVDQLQETLEKERDEYNNQRQSFLKRERELEGNVSDYSNALIAAQRTADEKIEEFNRQSFQMSQLTQQLKSSKQELEDYKSRAQNVLQEKEKEIRDLLESGTGKHSRNEKTENENALERQIFQLKEQLKFAQDQLKENSQATLEIQKQMELDQDKNQAKVSQLEEKLSKQSTLNQAIEKETRNKVDDIENLRSQLQQKDLQEQNLIKKHNEQLEKFKKQLQTKPTGSEEELEKRIQTLTEHLLQKQKQLDTVLSEKAYFQVQLEQVQQQQQQEKQSEKHTSIDVSSTPGGSSLKKRGFSNRNDNLGNDTDEEDPNSIATLLEHTPYVQQVPRVVGAGRMLDSVGTVTGSYLKKLPLLRLCVMLYILILHLWVFFVFLRWNPEMHNEFDFVGKTPDQVLTKSFNSSKT